MESDRTYQLKMYKLYLSMTKTEQENRTSSQYPYM